MSYLDTNDLIYFMHLAESCLHRYQVHPFNFDWIKWWRKATKKRTVFSNEEKDEMRCERMDDLTNLPPFDW